MIFEARFGQNLKRLRTYGDSWNMCLNGSALLRGWWWQLLLSIVTLHSQPTGEKLQLLDLEKCNKLHFRQFKPWCSHWNRKSTSTLGQRPDFSFLCDHVHRESPQPLRLLLSLVCLTESDLVPFASAGVWSGHCSCCLSTLELLWGVGLSLETVVQSGLQYCLPWWPAWQTVACDSTGRQASYKSVLEMIAISLA